MRRTEQVDDPTRKEGGERRREPTVSTTAAWAGSRPGAPQLELFSPATGTSPPEKLVAEHDLRAQLRSTGCATGALAPALPGMLRATRGCGQHGRRHRDQPVDHLRARVGAGGPAPIVRRSNGLFARGQGALRALGTLHACPRNSGSPASPDGRGQPLPSGRSTCRSTTPASQPRPRTRAPPSCPSQARSVPGAGPDGLSLHPAGHHYVKAGARIQAARPVRLRHDNRLRARQAHPHPANAVRRQMPPAERPKSLLDVAVSLKRIFWRRRNAAGTQG